MTSGVFPGPCSGVAPPLGVLFFARDQQSASEEKLVVVVVAPPPDPRLKPGSEFVASGGVKMAA